MQFQKYMPAGHCSKTVHYTDLNIWDGHRAFEDDPLHGLRAGWGGQRAIIEEVLLCGVGQETLQGERRDGAALSWPEKTGIVQMKIQIVFIFYTPSWHSKPIWLSIFHRERNFSLFLRLQMTWNIENKSYGPLLWCVFPFIIILLKCATKTVRISAFKFHRRKSNRFEGE